MRPVGAGPLAASRAVCSFFSVCRPVKADILWMTLSSVPASNMASSHSVTACFWLPWEPGHFAPLGFFQAAGWGNAWASWTWFGWLAGRNLASVGRSTSRASLVSAGSCTSRLGFGFSSAVGRLWVSRRHAVAPWFCTNLLGMICCSTSVGVPILTNCLDGGAARGSAQILALGPRRAPQRVLGGSLPLGWTRAYSGVRFTKAEAVGTTFRRPRRVLPWPVRLSNLFQQRL